MKTSLITKLLLALGLVFTLASCDDTYSYRHSGHGSAVVRYDNDRHEWRDHRRDRRDDRSEWRGRDARYENREYRDNRRGDWRHTGWNNEYDRRSSSVIVYR